MLPRFLMGGMILESSAAHTPGRSGTGAGRVVISLSCSVYIAVQEQISMEGDFHAAGFHIDMGSALLADTL